MKRTIFGMGCNPMPVSNVTEAEDRFIISAAELDSIKNEYERDLAAGLGIELPVNYFPDNDPAKKPKMTWRSCAHSLYAN